MAATVGEVGEQNTHWLDPEFIAAWKGAEQTDA
jgi:hypothetical protein